MATFLKANEFIQKLAGTVASVLLVALFLFVVFSVVSREFGLETNFSEEFTRYSIIMMVFIGAGFVLMRDRHVKMDLVLNKFPPMVKEICHISVSLASCFLMAVVLWAGFQMWSMAYQWNLVSETDLRIPLWIPQFSIPLGAGFLFLQSLSELLASMLSVVRNRLNEKQ
jgi:C4-dicarboxylate transporter DctQ subunit